MSYTKLPLRALSAAFLVLASAGPTLAQGGPPEPGPMDPVSFPDYAEHTLSNGAQVIVVENSEQPIVTVNLRIKSGSAFDPRGKEGLAASTASMLNKGTTTRDSKEIAESVDFLGASIFASAGDDWTSATATVLTVFLDEALDLMADMVKNPTFPEDEFEIERKRTLTALQVELSQAESVAQRRFINGIYGDHPYSSLPTEASVTDMQRADMVDFHSTYYRPGNALFVVAGDISPDDAVEKLEEYFGDWGGADVPALTAPAPPARSEREILFYHKPGSVEAVIRAGHLMEPATNPDWVSLDVMIRILGGGSQGWLYQVLRQEKGFTYGAYATAAKRIDQGYFVADTEVRNEVTDSSLAEMFTLLDRIRNEHVPEEDLKLAVDAMTGSFPRQIETPQQVAGQVATSQLRGLPEDYIEKYRDRVASVDAEEVQRVAQKHIHPDRMLVVIVGDANEIYDQVAEFGEVQLFDVEGNAITLADIAVAAATFTFDPSGIEPTTLVYDLSMQGNPLGEATNTITRETVDGREIIKAQENTGGMGFSAEQTLMFDAATFQGIQVMSGKEMGGRSMSVDLSMTGNVVTGSVAKMDGTTSEIDTEVPEGTLLPGQDSYAIWLADFENNTEVKIPAFNASSGTPYTLSLKVVGTSTVTVPAGDFEVYELDVTGAEATMKVFVRVAAPHIVVRQDFPGQPVSLLLKEIR